MKKFVAVMVLVGTTLFTFAGSVAINENGAAKVSVLSQHQFQYRHTMKDELGIHVRYAQTVDGVEVWGGEIIRHFNKQKLALTTGRIHQEINCGTVPVLTGQEAIDRVSADLQDAAFLIHGADLMIFPGDNDNYFLTYRVHADRDGSRLIYFVDAETGAVLFSYDNLKYRGGPPSSGDDPVELTPAVGSGIGVLGQTVTNLNTGFTGTLYQAVNLTRGAQIKTYDMSGSRRLPGALATDADNQWTDGSVVDAHKYLENVYDFYLNVFNRSSFDNNNGALVASVHYGTDYVNAYWDGSQMVFGDGDGETADSLAGAVDVIAHELTHAVTDYTSDLIYLDESGALNEAFSDIMGACVEFYWQPEGVGLLKSDWWMGEDIWYPNNPFGDALRYLDDPNLAWNGYTDSGYDPCHYDERYVGSADNGGVHINSTIGSHWFYLLAHGGTNAYSGLSVTGIGLDDAQTITYKAFTEYMPAGATFSDARTQTLNVAALLYGSGSVQYETVSAAWDAVGVF